jgi:hypothetical protein
MDNTTILKKLKPAEVSVRSRINADKELWDSIPILKQDSRTSGKSPKSTRTKKKKILDQ